jgi:hypothetical protein
MIDPHAMGALHTTPTLSEAVKVPHGPFRFSIRLSIGVTYEVFASGDLEAWAPVATGVSTDEHVEFSDAEAFQHAARFYRVVAGGKASRNIVGFAGTVIPPGFGMVSNPFLNDDNSVAALLPRVPEGTTLCKFDVNTSRLTNNAFKNGKWTLGVETLQPGEGAIFFNPGHQPLHLDFSGTVAQGELVNPLGAGFSLRGSMLPKIGRICGDLGLPLSDGDVIHVFDRKQQRYQVYKFPVKNWHSVQPGLDLCEGFWCGKVSPGSWQQRFEPSPLTHGVRLGGRRPMD